MATPRRMAAAANAEKTIGTAMAAEIGNPAIGSAEIATVVPAAIALRPAAETLLEATLAAIRVGAVAEAVIRTAETHVVTEMATTIAEAAVVAAPVPAHPTATTDLMETTVATAIAPETMIAVAIVMMTGAVAGPALPATRPLPSPRTSAIVAPFLFNSSLPVSAPRS